MRLNTLRSMGLVAIVLALAGCAATPISQDAAVPQPVSAYSEGMTEPENLPAVVLDTELLYQLLVAEFATQQGELQLAAQAYLHTAHSTADPRLAGRATRTAIYARDMETALQGARLWVDLEPKRLDARQSLAALLLRHGYVDEALPQMQALISLAPQGIGQGYMVLSDMLSQERDHAQALEIMRGLVELHPQEPLAHYSYAHLANQLGQYPQALQVLEALLSREPKMLDAMVLQARVHHAMGEPLAALTSMQQAVRSHPNNHQLRMIYARMLVDAQQYGAARQQFRVLYRSQPDDPDILYALALLALESGELDEAESHFLELLQFGTREEDARLSLAQIAQRRQQPSDAIEWYQSVGPDSERYMDAQIQAARLLMLHQDVDAALTHLRGLSLHSQEHISQRYLGEAELLSAAGKLHQAMEVYDEGVALFINDANLLYGRALLAERMDRLEQAEADLRRILEDDPEHLHALNALGYTLVDRTDRYQEGMRYIQQAYRLLPQDPDILDSMGWAYFRLGQLSEAEDYLRRAYAIKVNAEIAAHLGEVLWAQGRREEALQIWREASEIEADHPVLRDTLERLKP